MPVRLFIVLLCFPFMAFAQKEKLYTLHKVKPVVQSNIPFRTDGIYVQKGNIKWAFTKTLFFYADGTYCKGVDVHNSTVGDVYYTQQPFIDYLIDENKNYFNPNGMFGFYIVRNDTLYLESYPDRSSTLQSWQINKRTYRLSGDTLFEHSIQFRMNCCKYGRPHYIRDTTGYVFYPTPHKPDSSAAWFRTKEWYIQHQLKQKELK